MAMAGVGGGLRTVLASSTGGVGAARGVLRGLVCRLGGVRETASPPTARTAGALLAGRTRAPGAAGAIQSAAAAPAGAAIGTPAPAPWPRARPALAATLSDGPRAALAVRATPALVRAAGIAVLPSPSAAATDARRRRFSASAAGSATTATARRRHKPPSRWKRRIKVTGGGAYLFRRHGRRHLNIKMGSRRRNRLDRHAEVGRALKHVLKKLGVKG